MESTRDVNRLRRNIATWKTAAAATTILAAAGAFHARDWAYAQPVPAPTGAPEVTPSTTPSLETGNDVNPATTAPTPVETVQQLASILTNPELSQAQRDDAARRLAIRNSPDARKAMLDTLVDQNVGGQLAVARALAVPLAMSPEDDPSASAPDPVFINPLFAAFGANDRLTDVSARALANYRSNPEVLARLLPIATDSRARGQLERTRASVIRAIGSFPDKRAAGELVAIVRNSEETVVIRHASADALVTMTGLIEFGQDAQQWERWWTIHQPKNDLDFRNDMLARKAQQLERVQARLNLITAELQNKAAELYQVTPSNQKESVLLRELQSVEQELRVWAARQVADDFTGGRNVSQAVREQLRGMIGDAVPQVRVAVVRSVGLLNDGASLEALLRQAAIENDSGVRAAVADALKGMNDPRAAETLLKLLEDPSRAVSRSSAAALRELGPRLLEQDAALARRVSVALRAIIDRPASTPADVELRETCIEALVPLKQRELIPTLIPRLLRPAESPRVRRAALQALGEIGEPNTADTIVAAIGDPDAGVSLEAVRALGKVNPTPTQIEALRPLLTETRRDPSIRDEAWTVLQSALPSLTREQLNLWADRFRADPQRAIVVYKTLLAKLVADKAMDEAAAAQQQIADAYMALTPPDPESAVPFYKAALEHRQANRPGGPVLAQLTDSYMKALLRSGNYEDAIAFASEQLKRDGSNQQSMGAAIRTEADKLTSTGKPEDLRKAQQLIELALTMSPPLAEQYLDALRTLKRTVEAKLG